MSVICFLKLVSWNYCLNERNHFLNDWHDLSQMSIFETFYIFEFMVTRSLDEDQFWIYSDYLFISYISIIFEITFTKHKIITLFRKSVFDSFANSLIWKNIFHSLSKDGFRPIQNDGFYSFQNLFHTFQKTDFTDFIKQMISLIWYNWFQLFHLKEQHVTIIFKR